MQRGIQIKLSNAANKRKEKIERRKKKIAEKNGVVTKNKENMNIARRHKFKKIEERRRRVKERVSMENQMMLNDSPEILGMKQVPGFERTFPLFPRSLK